MSRACKTYRRTTIEDAETYLKNHGVAPGLHSRPEGLLLSQAVGRGQYVRATRDAEGRYAFVYIPNPGQTVRLDFAEIAGERVWVSWCDPRTGQPTALGDFPTRAPQPSRAGRGSGLRARARQRGGSMKFSNRAQYPPHFVPALSKTAESRRARV
ncbi:MAG TPA: putative collagen-binding domain-containing protein [Ardenticatenaceae bacterium]|nr:putative collagen-binding domain-containing protein [Ardenticatenaceae bacterium]